MSSNISPIQKVVSRHYKLHEMAERTIYSLSSMGFFAEKSNDVKLKKIPLYNKRKASWRSCTGDKVRSALLSNKSKVWQSALSPSHFLQRIEPFVKYHGLRIMNEQNIS